MEPVPRQFSAYVLIVRTVKEMQEATSNEVILGILGGIAAFAYKGIFGGGISVNDAASIAVPALWTLLFWTGLQLQKAARKIHDEAIAPWLQEAPVLRGPKPSPAKVAVTAVSFYCVLALTFWLSTLVPAQSTEATQSDISTHTTPTARTSSRPALRMDGADIGESVVGQRTLVRVGITNTTDTLLSMVSGSYISTFEAFPPGDSRRAIAEGLAFSLAHKAYKAEISKGEIARIAIPPGVQVFSMIPSGAMSQKALDSIRRGKTTFYAALMASYLDSQGTERAFTFCGFVEPQTGVLSLCHRHNENGLPIADVKLSVQLTVAAPTGTEPTR